LAEVALRALIVKAEQLLALEQDQSFKHLARVAGGKTLRMPYNIFCFIPGDHSTFMISIDKTGLDWWTT